MTRLEKVREKVDAVLDRVDDMENRRCGFVHLYGVSATATLLAGRRGIDVELAAIAGMLHDLASYEIGDADDHARRSSLRAAALFRELDVFSEAEIDAVCSAIARHSDKARVDGPMAELLKDADVLQHLLYDPCLSPVEHHAARREALAREFGWALPGTLSGHPET